MRSLVVACLLLLTGQVVAAPARHYTTDELTVLNGLGGWGDVGVLDSSREIVRPGSRLGFSVMVDWTDRPAEPNFWSIRHGLPPVDMARFDTFSFAIYVEYNAGAELAVYLTEPSDNRWICRGGPLADLPVGQWVTVTVSRDQMRPWKLSKRPMEWLDISGVAVECARGKALFYIDDLKLTGPGGAVAHVLDPTDEVIPAYPVRTGPLIAPRGPGGLYFPLDLARMSDPGLRASPSGLRDLLGPVSTPLAGLGRSLASVAAGLRAEGIPALYYAPFGDGFQRFITRRGGWDANAAGASLNSMPGPKTNWDFRHTYALAHPAVTEAQHRRIDALVKAGISTWMVVDYTFPWMDTWWGYSDSMRKAYIADLQGKDEGIALRGPGAARLRFAEYFRRFQGFAPEPRDAGVRSWAEYQPPMPGENSPRSRARTALFLALRSYEWVKLPDRVGRYYRSRGGNPLWIIPNPEDPYGSSDYVTLLQARGVGNLFPEWFGCIGLAAEAGAASLPYLREVADRAGSRLSIIHESGAGGHADPYLDWRMAYAGVYALTAVGRLDDFDNDFVDDAGLDEMKVKVDNAYRFGRFRDTVAKASAFRQARADWSSRPVPPILCVADRPPARHSPSIFFGLAQPYSLGLALARAHLPFDLRDQPGAEGVLERYRMVVYTPMAPRPGDLERLRLWLAARPGRTLVTTALVLSRSTREWWNTERAGTLGHAIDARCMGIGAVRAGTASDCVVTRSSRPWANAFLDGYRVVSGTPFAVVPGTTPLVGDGAACVVSSRPVGKGRLVCVHAAWEELNRPEYLDAAVRLVRAAAGQVGIRPICAADSSTSVQLLPVRGGNAAVLWDVPSLESWRFEYRPGIAPLGYRAPAVDRTVYLPAAAGSTYLVYDVMEDRQERVVASAAGVALALRGRAAALVYVGRDTGAFRAVVAGVSRSRAKLRALGFDDGPAPR